VNDVLFVLVVVIALGFDFTNGFHDTANAIATSVGTRALTPRVAVLIASVANLAGAFVTTAVAKNIATGIIDANLATLQTLLAALFGAIAWNLLTWWLGLPSSFSHALIGGLIGAALAQSGSDAVQWHEIVYVIPAVFAPAIAFAAAFLLLVFLYWIFRWLNPGIAARGFRLGQLVSGTWVAFTHGANDAQKTMGVTALAIVLHDNGDVANLEIPNWVKVSAGVAIGLGTYVGGWRIIRTLGQRVVRMEPESGFAAQAAAGTTIYLATKYGYPLSTTHVVSGAVMGAGATRRLSAVRWGVAGNILVAWVLTIPAAALVAAAFYWPIQAIF